MNNAAPVKSNFELTLTYGHNQTAVVMQMSKLVDNLTMSPEQVDSVIENLRLMKCQLKRFQIHRADGLSIDDAAAAAKEDLAHGLG